MGIYELDNLVQDRECWWALVKKVMKLLVPKKAGNFLTSWMT
jgi:hypothetical protein